MNDTIKICCDFGPGRHSPDCQYYQPEPVRTGGEVKRYTPYEISQENAFTSAAITYVRHSDYQSKCEELDRVKVELQNERSISDGCRADASRNGERAERAESSNAALREALSKFQYFAPRCSQLLDGWHQDGTAWSEWDESVRKELSELHRMCSELISVHVTLTTNNTERAALSEDGKQEC